MPASSMDAMNPQLAAWRRLWTLGEYHGSRGVIDEYHRIASPACELCEEVRELRRTLGLG
jgi:hypothetical protein